MNEREDTSKKEPAQQRSDRSGYLFSPMQRASLSLQVVELGLLIVRIKMTQDWIRNS